MNQHHFKLWIGILCLGLFTQIRAFSQTFLPTTLLSPYSTDGCDHMPRSASFSEA